MQSKLLIYMKKIINKFKLKEETTTHTNIIIMIKLQIIKIKLIIIKAITGIKAILDLRPMK